MTLSAYLDQELSPRWQQAVEKALQKSPALRAELASLERVRGLLNSLPRHPLPPSVAGPNPLLALHPLSAPPANPLEGAADQVNVGPLKADSLNVGPLEADQVKALLLAYAYGELDVRSREQVDRLLLTSSAHRRSLEDHQRVARALSELPKRELPPEVLAIAVDRLATWAAESDAPSDEVDMPARATWGEYLSAYLDGELSTKKSGKIERRLEESEPARRYLRDLTRVQAGLQQLANNRCPDVVLRSALERVAAEVGQTTPNHLERVPAGTIDIDWPEDRPSPLRRPPRSLGWSSLAGIAASIVVVAGVGFVLSGLPLQTGNTLTGPSPQAPPPAIAARSAPAVQRSTAMPIGYEQIAPLPKAGPREIVDKLDSRQITISARDVQRFLDDLGPIGETLKRSEPTSAGGRLIELTGTPQEIAELMGRLAETSTRGKQVDEISVAPPKEDALAQIRLSSDRWVVSPEKRLVLGMITSLDRGLKSLQSQWPDPTQQPPGTDTPEDPTEGTALAEDDSAAPPANNLSLPNEPLVLARPLRILLVVTPSSRP
jgi:anti-sigma factor RsiW